MLLVLLLLPLFVLAKMCCSTGCACSQDSRTAIYDDGVDLREWPGRCLLHMHNTGISK
jgi:hypothetical protein